MLGDPSPEQTATLQCFHKTSLCAIFAKNNNSATLCALLLDCDKLSWPWRALFFFFAGCVICHMVWIALAEAPEYEVQSSCTIGPKAE